MIVMLRIFFFFFLICQQWPKVKDPLSDPKRKHPLPHVSYDSYLSTRMGFCRTHEYIGPHLPQKSKKIKQWSVLLWWGSEGRGSLPALLWAQAWQGLDIFVSGPHFHLSSVACSLSKQAVFTKTATSQADGRATLENKRTDALPGGLQGPSLSHVA